jgi:hypothetical protein
MIKHGVTYSGMKAMKLEKEREREREKSDNVTTHHMTTLSKLSNFDKTFLNFLI